MEFLSFLHENPVMGWFVFLTLLVTVVPVASVLWRRMLRRGQDEVVNQTEHETKSTHFGNQADLLISFIGFALLLIVIGWIRSIFFG